MTDFRFDVPVHRKSIIKVIGVGGGGSNAVGYMYTQGIEDVDFIVCNTDHQALEINPVKEKIQIGSHLTEGLGAGARPEVGCNAAKESREDIRKMLSQDTKMLFITAGMGGGTGTGAAPVIAEVAKDLGILTVGIVTMPFNFEGRKKRKYAEDGVAELKKYCDTVLVILNERLKEIYSDLDIDEAFSRADDILTNAARSIAQIITHKAKMNVDFEDVRTVMRNSGQTVMGSSIAVGKGRAMKAVENALSSPLLNNREVTGAQRVLLSITYSEDEKLKIDELAQITNYVEDMVGEESDEVIWGHGVDNTLQSGEVRVTIIATGFAEEQDEVRKVVSLESSREVDIHKRPVSTTFQANQLLQNESVRAEDSNVVKLDLNDDSESFSVEKREENAVPASSSEIKMNEIRDRLKRMEEVRRLRGNGKDDNSYNSYFEEPAFARRNKQITDTPSSSNSNLSRYSLNDDDEIVGNNRFFDDNVD
jgi:cell division protein FtsZ